MTNLEKLNSREILDLSKRFFYFGFALLPMFWLLNFVWIYSFIRSKTEEQISDVKEIKWFTVASGIGSLIWLFLLVAWFTVFITQRTEWGLLGDQLSVLIPLGS